MTCAKWFQKLSTKWTSGFERAFEAYGSFIFKYYLYILIVSLIVFSSLVYGFITVEEEIDDEQLWIPQNSLGVKQQNVVADAYGIQYRRLEFYLTAKAPETKQSESNAITAAVYKTIINFDETFKEKVKSNNRNFYDICEETPYGYCPTSFDPLDFLLKSDGTYDQSVLNSDSTLLQRINSGKGHDSLYDKESIKHIPIEGMFGGTNPEEVATNSDGTNNIKEAKSIRWQYLLPDDKFSSAFFEEYELELETFAEDFNKENDEILIYMFSKSSISRDTREALKDDSALITIAVNLIIIFTVLVTGRLNTYRSRWFVGTAGVAIVYLSYIEAIGLGSYFGLKTNPPVRAIPFLLLGIGVDDMFILLSSYAQASEQLNAEDKVKYMMKRAGVSVTITSLTNVLVFAVGTITSIKAIRDFCVFASLGIIIDYLNQLTMFLAVFIIDVKFRSEKGRGDGCGLMSCKPDSKYCCHGKYNFNEDGSVKESPIRNLMSGTYGRFLMKTPVRIIVILFFLVLLGLNIYGLFKLDRDFNREWFVLDDYYISDTIDVREKYYDDSQSLLNFYTVDSDFEKSSVQKELKRLSSLIDECHDCSTNWIIKGSTDSWYDTLNDWVKRGNCAGVALADSVIPENSFYLCLKEWLNTDEGELYSFVFAWDSDKIEAAAITCSFPLIEGTADKVKSLDELRDIGDEGPGNTFPYNPVLLWHEHHAVFGRETAIELSASIAVVFIVTLLLLADAISAGLVMVMVGATVIGQMALLYYWGEALNIVTMINSVMAVGISVDYNAHFVHTFKNTVGETRVERVVATFYVIGVDIFSGGFSTFLAIIVLMLGKTYIIEMFFKSWLGTIVYGLAHALILFPVVLSFIGPKSVKCHSKVINSDIEQRDERKNNHEDGQQEDNAEKDK